MLDFFTILTKGGLVLFWYQDQMFNAASDIGDRINKLIHEAMLEGRTNWQDGQMAMKYKLDNTFDLVFVVGYNTMLRISYADKFLDAIQNKFREKYRGALTKETCHQLFNSKERRALFKGFQNDFDAEYDSHRGQKQTNKMKSYQESTKSKKTVASMMIQKNAKKTAEPVVEAASPNSVGGTSTSSTEESSDESSDDGDAEGKTNFADTEREMMNVMSAEEKRKQFLQKQKEKNSQRRKGKGVVKKSKEKTVWDDVRGSAGGKKKNKAADDVLDYSAPAPVSSSTSRGALHKDDMDIKTGRHKKIENLAPAKATAAAPSNKFLSMFSNLTSKTLNAQDIQPVLDKMKEHLISKNVAANIAEKLCNSISLTLDGKKYSTFAGINNEVRGAVEQSLTTILTPKRRVDILRDVVHAKSQKRPYIITFCGVNGVGKSTNLAKICFWLIENGYDVLIAAGDTFRAGAVEQLKTHVRRLNSLHPPRNADARDRVALYDQGYGKDAADIAFHAIKEAKATNYDVVLVDTAGRMQDNAPLMIALAKLITVNKPDLVLFVGEALVGNEAVDQLVKFNQALADNSRHIKDAQTIDGIVLTKFDTIDDKVGAAISMTYTTGQPIVFVGTGQSYPDLRSLNIKSVVAALLKV